MRVYLNSGSDVAPARSDIKCLFEHYVATTQSADPIEFCIAALKEKKFHVLSPICLSHLSLHIAICQQLLGMQHAGME